MKKLLTLSTMAAVTLSLMTVTAVRAEHITDPYTSIQSDGWHRDRGEQKSEHHHCHWKKHHKKKCCGGHQEGNQNENAPCKREK